MTHSRIHVPQDRIAAFCRRWQITELALFGSVLRDDFGPDSDVDVLATFAAGAGFTFDNRVDMVDEISDLLGREVDLVDSRLIRNPFRRHSILTSREVIYAA